MITAKAANMKSSCNNYYRTRTSTYLLWYRVHHTQYANGTIMYDMKNLTGLIVQLCRQYRTFRHSQVRHVCQGLPSQTHFITGKYSTIMINRVIHVPHYISSQPFRPTFLALRVRITHSRLSSRTMSSTVDSDLMSKMTEEEKKITGQNNPVRGGPTAQAQSHANQPLSAEVIHDITKGEEKITGNPSPVKGGPTSTAQSILTKVSFLLSFLH